MKQRETLVGSLLEAKTRHDWQGCCEILFRVLFGVPADTQLSLVRFAICRYLPVFEFKWPTIKWPVELLSDIDQWLISRGRTLPEEPADPDPADSAFAFAFDALLLASIHRDDGLTLTSSCAAAVSSVVNARQCNVWIADDPEGVALWRAQGYFPGRSVLENRPAMAVAEREWEEIAAWLASRDVWTDAKKVAPEEIENALARWKEYEMLPVVLSGSRS